MIRAFTSGPFTGRHFTIIIVAFFAVVVTVNVIMARAASRTFGGVVVENSYVASQKFNGWLREADRQKALGWSAASHRRSDGRVVIVLAGLPQGEVIVQGDARHPLGRMADQPLTFKRGGDGSYVSAQPLAAGRWYLRLAVRAGGQVWRSDQELK
ncbi:MAG: FixH family protein [Novosphingobium sp.]|uniref:FixH family protein n=1 Tax=Novosphingobium sp. TaxID=1874826 RepID=UPI0032BEBAFD